MAQQTAVEWLEKQLDNNLDIKHSWRTKQYIEQAKQMEKEQICDALDFGKVCLLQSNYKKAEQYYNETFGKN